MHPPDKAVYVVVPHTSGWDFIIGILTRGATGLKVKFLGKQELFKPPFGFVFRWAGGFPVDRSKRTSLVEQVAAIFNRHEKFAIAVAPEGTRKKVNSLKTGFYYIARIANIPLILVKLDFGNRIVDFSKPFLTTGNFGKDIEKINRHFQGVKGKIPELSFGID